MARGQKTLLHLSVLLMTQSQKKKRKRKKITHYVWGQTSHLRVWFPTWESEGLAQGVAARAHGVTQQTLSASLSAPCLSDE